MRFLSRLRDFFHDDYDSAGEVITLSFSPTLVGCREEDLREARDEFFQALEDNLELAGQTYLTKDKRFSFRPAGNYLSYTFGQQTV